MNTFYLRIIDNIITHVFRFNEFPNLYTCTCDCDLLNEVDKYGIDRIDEENKIVIIKEKEILI